MILKICRGDDKERRTLVRRWRKRHCGGDGSRLGSKRQLGSAGSSQGRKRQRCLWRGLAGIGKAVGHPCVGAVGASECRREARWMLDWIEWGGGGNRSWQVGHMSTINIGVDLI